MSSYVMDVSSPEIKEAMHELGIEPRELLKLSKQSFMSPQTPVEISNIRFSYYRSKLQDTVSKIKTLIEENASKPPTKKSDKSPIGKQVSLKEEVLKNRMKNRKIIRSVMEEIQHSEERAKKITENKPKRAPVPSNKKEVKLISEYTRILDDKEIHEIKAFRDKSFDLQHSRIKDLSRKSSFSRIETLPDNMLQRLAEIELKQKKSKRIHDELLKAKQATAAKSLEKVDEARRSKQDQESNEVLLRLINKHIEFEKRRSKIKEQLQDSIQQRKIHEENKQKIKSDIAKESDQHQKLKARAIEERSQIISQSIEDKQHISNFEQVKRSEFNRLRDLDAHINQGRNKRKLDLRREQILEKHIQATQRINALKREKEAAVELQRKKNHIFMLDKEKLYEALEAVKKQPNCPQTLEKLRRFKLSP